jgi:magnesium chelatase family protein
MGYAQVHAVALAGMVGQLVVVESDVANGLPTLVLSGLPDAALSQSRDRVRAAVVNSGEAWPQRRITVNLLPAHLPKYGSAFDLAVAVSLLAAAGALPPDHLNDAVLIGELGLDGKVLPVRGAGSSIFCAATVRCSTRRQLCRLPRPRASISPTLSGRTGAAGRSNWPRPAATTSRCSAHREPGRPCSRSECRRFSRRSTTRRPWK